MNLAQFSNAQLDGMSMAEVRAAIGTGRAAWVEVLSAGGRLAILIRAARLGDAVLVRYAEPRGCMHWIALAHLRRRADLDHSPEPQWLQRARSSSRPPAILADILDPRTRFDRPEGAVE
jgi:hypothetical protein